MSKSKREQRGNARIQVPQRKQVEMYFFALDEMIREDHLVRLVVAYVDTLDLSELYDAIKATNNNVGRTPIDPRILFALWLFGTLEGRNSGREIARLVERDLAYMWICGGVSVNSHSLCDFRVKHGPLLDRILTDSITVLFHQGLIELNSIAQDGMRVRASAGTSSFKKKQTLDKAYEEAKKFYEQVRDQDDDRSGTPNQSVQQRAAQEKLTRIEAAQRELEKLQERHQERNRSKSEKHQTSAPRASITDSDARRMKMGDSGFRPAYNVQFGSDVGTMVIVGADVSKDGNDAGLLAPMYDEICERYDTRPKEYLADGGFSKKPGVEHVEKAGTKFYGTLYREKKQLSEGKNPYAPRSREGKHFTAFRVRMGTKEAQEIYRKRAAAAEFPNANCRNQGLYQFAVRGLSKVKAQALWHVIAYNFRRFNNLVDQKTNQTYLKTLMNA